MPSPVLEISGLTVRYQRRRRSPESIAVRGVSIDIGVGETVGLVGESGSGKSSIGNAVLGLVPAASGRIAFDGREITGLQGHARRALARDIQAVFQDPYTSFNPHRTVGQSVGETLTTVPDMTPAKRAARMREMLERVGLDGTAARRYPSQFSGGQRQRIAIARALMPSPRLVVCDESVSALDLSVQAQVLNLFMELQRDFGVSYLFITHDLSVVQHISNRVAVLKKGELLEFGPTDDVIGAPSTAYTRQLLAAAPVPDPDAQMLRRTAGRAWRALTSGEAADRSAATSEERAQWQRDIERLAVYEAARTRNARIGDQILAHLDSASVSQAACAVHKILFESGVADRQAAGSFALAEIRSSGADTTLLRRLADAIRDGDVTTALSAVDRLWTRQAAKPASV